MELGVSEARDRWYARAAERSREQVEHMPDKITVLLVDDHALVRRGFRRMLEDDPAISVCGEASDGAEE